MATETIIIDFWDVGQGDGSIIRLPDGKIIIIDIGPKGSPIIDWLSDRRPIIHSIVISHNDEDHAGSLPSLVKMPGLSIEAIFMLLDRDKKSDKFQKIWRPVREEHEKKRFPVLQLTADSIIWQQNQTYLKVVYPNFVQAIDAKSPNENSAVVCLFHNDEMKIVWPGDAPMGVVADKCSAATPYLLHGPHHGAPIDRNDAEFSNSTESFKPERVFVSVGTTNKHNHPSTKYIKLQKKFGRNVCCSQLTKLCDNIHVNTGAHVLPSAALLGLRPPRRGISCRGCLRLKISNGLIEPDEWDVEHLNRINKLRRPMCL